MADSLGLEYDCMSHYRFSPIQILLLAGVWEIGFGSYSGTPSFAAHVESSGASASQPAAKIAPPATAASKGKDDQPATSNYWEAENLELEDDSESASPEHPEGPDAAPAIAPSPPATDPSPALPSPSLPEASNSPPLVPGPRPTSDPAEQIAPAAIELTPGNRPISPFMAITMKEELINLIGRFESAQLMADSFDLPTQIQVAQANSVLTASLTPVAGEGEEAHPKPAELPATLAAARQLLADWDGLIERGDYGTARERWQAVQRSLWDNFPTDRPFGQPEVRAIWLDRGTIVAARNQAGLATVFDRLAAAGINTVFFETINAGYPIYPSEVAPAQNPMIRGWDPLAAAVELAHERDMELHAWVWTFAAGNQRHNRLLNWPADYPGPVLASHPDWAGYDNRGNVVPLGQLKPFFDPANQEVRGYLLRLISEVITRYDVDGVQLDYIRYPFQDPGADRTYGYGQAARWRFQGLTGVDPIDLSPRPDLTQSRENQQRQRQLWDRWTDFRIQQVSSFVYAVSQMIDRQRPEVTLSTAVFAIPEHERLQKIQQDWGTWAREGYVDWIVLMSYAQDTNRFEQLVTPWLLEDDFDTTLIIPSVRLLNLEPTAAIDQMQAARDLPAPGYALFAATDLDEALEAILSQTQGAAIANTTDFLPQSAPYRAALGRYQALQREWNWLLTRDQLWMDREKLNQWAADVNALEQSLKTLADQPSARGLQTVRQQLATVRTALQSQILVETTSSRYRLETWQHRLTTIERLLAYGEREAKGRPDRADNALTP